MNNTGIKRTCSKCGQDLKERYGKYRYCLECHKAYMRQNRPKHSELKPEQKSKVIARAYANRYLKLGKLKIQPCQICGSMENLEKHHNDYSKPLEVIWLCRKHHIEVTLKQRSSIFV